MKKSVMKKWVKALRSGEYRQGKDRLVDGKDRFCCLGVLCNISPAREGRWVKDTKRGWCFSGPDKTNEGAPTPNVKKWAGLKSDNPIIGAHNLAEYNDDLNYTFDQIADLIEENWEHI